MSSINKKRIKGLRRYTQNSETPFSNMIPFGTDGDLVDIFSGLDLEEELLLGGRKTISFQEPQDALIITEKYFDRENNCCYSKVSNLTSANTYQVIQATEGEEEGVLGDVQEDQSTLIGDFLGRLELEITVYLYKGDVDEDDSTLLHIKNIKLNNGVFEETIQNFNPSQENIDNDDDNDDDDDSSEEGGEQP